LLQEKIKRLEPLNFDKIILFGSYAKGKPTLEDAKKFYNISQNIFDEVCTVLQINENDLKI